jgi:hypothetical protein
MPWTTTEVEMDKCTEQYTLRIPEITKAYLDKLTPEEKKVLKNRLLLCMADVIHNSDAIKNPMLYLKSD